MFDALDRKIKVGDLVTYPVRRGSVMYVQVGVVTGLDLDGERGLLIAREGKQVKVTETDRVTIAVRGSDIRAAQGV